MTDQQEEVVELILSKVRQFIIVNSLTLSLPLPQFAADPDTKILPETRKAADRVSTRNTKKLLSATRR